MVEDLFLEVNTFKPIFKTKLIYTSKIRKIWYKCYFESINLQKQKVFIMTFAILSMPICSHIILMIVIIINESGLLKLIDLNTGIQC